jgi:hypothetical protein
MSGLLRGVHPSTEEERKRFWASLIRILEPVCRIHCHLDSEDDDRVVQG